MKSAVFVTLAFLLGAVVAAVGCLIYLEGKYYSGPELAKRLSEFEFNFKKSEAVRVTSGLDPIVGALLKIRENKLAEAQSILESAVDSNVMLLSSPFSVEKDSFVQIALRRTAEYRFKYPYRSGIDLVDSEVKEILSKTSQDAQ